jgi:hypothetical protein
MYYRYTHPCVFQKIVFGACVWYVQHISKKIKRERGKIDKSNVFVSWYGLRCMHAREREKQIKEAVYKCVLRSATGNQILVRPRPLSPTTRPTN